MTQTTMETNPESSGSRKWAVMIAVSMGIFLATIDGSIVNIALPTLETTLNASFALVQWVVLGYLLTVATLMLAIGRLADMFGKKPLYLAGFAIFTVGSGLCGISTSIGMLIAFRILQAIGAAMTMALGTAIVTEAFPPEERGKALGITGMMVSLGLISGPTLGGIILGALNWHWIFFVNLPVGVIGIAMVVRFVPAMKPEGARERFDFRGAAAMFVMLLSFLLALTIGEQEGFANPLVIGLFVLFAATLALFIYLEAHTAHPLVDLELFRNRGFSMNLLTGLMIFIGTSGIVLLMPFYLQNVLGLNPSASGLLLSVVPLSMGITAPISGVLSDRFGKRWLTSGGLLLMLLAYISICTLGEHTSMLGYALRFLPAGIGMGLFQSPNNSAIMGSAPRNRLGVASGLLSLSRTVGQVTGLAVLGAIWASLVFAQMGAGFQGETTSAPAAVQVAALNYTTLVPVILIGAAFGISVWMGWGRARETVEALPTAGK